MSSENMGDGEGDAMSCASSGGSGRKASVRKSREELNDIEKQRTKRINQHIVALRNLLEMSNIATKKDKFSVLKNTYDYIVKLRQDIAQLNRRPVNESSTMQTASNKGDGSSESSSICYDSLFTDAHAAMALASVDGQFLRCNEKFERLSGYNSRDITKISIFNCTVPEEMNQLFNVIGTLLSHPDQTARHFWKTCKFHDTIETCFVSIWLVRRKDEEASCFQMIMVPLAECDGVWTTTGPVHQNGRPVTSTDKADVEQWASVQQGLASSPGGSGGGTMGAGGMVGMGGDGRETHVKTETEDIGSISSTDCGQELLLSSGPFNLAGNLTEAANSLATVQYSGEGGGSVKEEEEEGDWLYADLFSTITEEDLQNGVYDNNDDEDSERGSENSLKLK